jgi:nicotinamide-nucleotide amidase
MSEQITAELIAIGEEVLAGQTISSNTSEIAAMLAGIGIVPHHHSEVGDRSRDIAQALMQAVERSRLIIITGGLGPTSDDITRPVVADTLGLPLVRDESIVHSIEERFQTRGSAMPASNLVQADVPAGGKPLPNPLGTAPGLYIPHQLSHIFLLPGVPAEMRALMRQTVLPMLGELFPGLKPRYVRKLRVVGLPESRLADLLADAQWAPGLGVAYLPQENEIYLLFKGEKEAADQAADYAYGKLGAHIYSEGEVRMPELVGRLLRERDLTLATAESCTGGLVGKMLTDIAGSSDYYLGGAVVYSNHAKAVLAGVDPALIAELGAVSAPVAKALAEGIRSRLGADLALGITGIAGPGGGSAGKPVGLVYGALATANETIVRRWQFGGGRQHIRKRAATWALDLVRCHLLNAWEQL